MPKKFAIRLIYMIRPQPNTKFICFILKSQTFFETLSYFPFIPPPPTGSVSQTFISDSSRPRKSHRHRQEKSRHKVSSLGLGFQFFEYLAFGFGYFANLLQISN